MADKEFNKQERLNEIEDSEWIESIKSVYEISGSKRVQELLKKATNIFTKAGDKRPLFGKHALYKYYSSRKTA